MFTMHTKTHMYYTHNTRIPELLMRRRWSVQPLVGGAQRTAGRTTPAHASAITARHGGGSKYDEDDDNDDDIRETVDIAEPKTLTRQTSRRILCCTQLFV